jgi:hypothetical protein
LTEMLRASFLLIVAALQTSAATAGPEDSFHIVLSRKALRAGEQVEMKLLPPVPPGVRASWHSATGKEQLTYYSTYRAPYVIPAGAPPATVRVSLSGLGIKTTLSAEIELLPSSIADADSCLGPNQSFSMTGAGLVPDFVFVDDLPNVLQHVAPAYPKDALVRGLEDTIPIQALVCRTGRVLDAYALESYANTDDVHPVEHDPKLVEAAIAAVRQYIFSPARKDGQAMAVWVMVPVAFRR